MFRSWCAARGFYERVVIGNVNLLRNIFGWGRRRAGADSMTFTFLERLTTYRLTQSWTLANPHFNTTPPSLYRYVDTPFTSFPQPFPVASPSSPNLLPTLSTLSVSLPISFSLMPTRFLSLALEQATSDPTPSPDPTYPPSYPQFMNDPYKWVDESLMSLNLETWLCFQTQREGKQNVKWKGNFSTAHID